MLLGERDNFRTDQQIQDQQESDYNQEGDPIWWLPAILIFCVGATFGGTVVWFLFLFFHR